MTFYFRLQYKLLNRKLEELGIIPVLAYVFGTLILAGITELLFNKVHFAGWLMALFALSIQMNLGGKQRIDFLKLCFTPQIYPWIRIGEHLVVLFPFAVFMLWKQAFVEIVVAFVLSIVIAIYPLGITGSRTLPTPFSRYPFEFSVGFRRTFLLFPIVYLLAGIAIQVGNFNLGMFSLLVLALVMATYYNEAEEPFFVWNHAMQPKGFLWHKLKIAYRYFSLLALPIATVLCFVFKDQWETIILVQVAGYIYLTTFLLAKYANYPRNISIPQGIFIALGIGFPPLMLLIMPLFYTRALKHLSYYLK